MKVNLLNLTAAHNHHLWPHLNKQKPNCTSTYQLSWYIIVMRQSSPHSIFSLLSLTFVCGVWMRCCACMWLSLERPIQAIYWVPRWYCCRHSTTLENKYSGNFFWEKLILMWNYFLHFFSKSNPQDHVPSDNRLSTGRQEKRKNLKIHFEI